MEGTSLQLVDSSLLEKIDKVFACNAGDLVDLPQLVVVGHQSSGKSSVLEGLTGIPFPRDKGLCTRFATQITFRRANEQKFAASIIPADGGSDEHRERMKGWTREMQTLDAASFKSIMSEVIELMGVGSYVGGARRAFSRDVLVLEIAGPSQEHFSVIDVPGTFKRTTQGVTTKEDIALVDQMVREYMSNPRSVMLTVVPSNADIANEEVVEQAEDLDPEGNRTLGVLTKPDLVDPGAEDAVIDLIAGRRQRLKLGWHLLRNPGQAELLDGSRTRNAIEKEFFAMAAPWNSLDKSKVGVESLRSRLQDILAGHIRREFPKVRADINRKLKETEKKLKQLGPKRQSQSEQTQFLVDMALRFQEIAASASRADYGRVDFFNDDQLRLATVAVNRGELFAQHTASRGHTHQFGTQDSAEVVKPEPTHQQEPGNESEPRPQRNSNSVRFTVGHGDVEDILHPDVAISQPRDSDILVWLKAVHHASRGFELGTFDSALLAVTLKQQAIKWRDLALGYVSDVIAMVHSFLVKLLDHVTPSDRVCQGLTGLLVEDVRKKYQAALEHTNFLLQVELEGTPATLNHYFNDTLTKCRQERLQKQLDGMALDDCTHGSVIRVSDMVHSNPLSNDEHTIHEIHDILLSYYELARKRFVDNVRMQVADYFLVTGPDTPLKLFSPRFVAAMSNEQLEDVAGEDGRTRQQRANLEREAKVLENARGILQ